MFKLIMRIKSNIGFTLIELIVAVAIIGIMASAAMAVIDPITQFNKAHDARVKSDLSQIQKALEIYYQDKGVYPQNCGDYTINITSPFSCLAWGSSWSPYINVLPKDPASNNAYQYYRIDGQTYYLYANLKRGVKDPQVCNSGARCASAPVNVNCGGICNFGVSSPNATP